MRSTILKNMNVDQQILIASKNVHIHGYVSAPRGRNASMWRTAVLVIVTLISLSPLRTSAQPTCDPLVVDVEPPLITCPADLTINSDPGECFAVTTLTPPTVTDNCDGVLGNALDFDGIDDRVSIANPVGSVFTLEAWIKTSAPSLTGIYAYDGNGILWSDVAFNANDFTLAILNDRLSFFDGSGSVVTNGTTILNDDVWHHIAVVRDGVGGITRLYVDGNLEISNACNNVAINTNPEIVIGGNPFGGYFNGSIDEVRIWNTARTVAELQDNKSIELSAQTGLLAIYPFNEGIAGADNAGITTANDASGNGNNGTLNNFALTGNISNWVVGWLNRSIDLTNNAPETYPIGSTTVNWTATDAAGNTATCDQVVTVVSEGPVPDLNSGWKEAQKVLASDGVGGDWFGRSVAISGNVAIVGAHHDDDDGLDSGSAYVFEKDTEGNWTLVKKLTASDGGSTDQFGLSVAISGSTAIVGAYWEDEKGADAGSAYVFEKDAGGVDNWGQVKKLTASDGSTADNFGWSVAISGSTAIVGAYLDDNENGGNSGSAYVFEKDAGGLDNWGQVQKLKASDGAANDLFGYSVAISASTVIVGAYGDDENGPDYGAAYVFEKDAGGLDNWGEVKKLTASDGFNSDYFGYSVAISGSRAIVGAYRNDENGPDSGAAFVFEKDAGGEDNWGQVKKLTASDGSAIDHFGYSVSISGRAVIVGARWEDAYGTDSGSAYIFEKDAGGSDNWGEVKKLNASDESAADQFGYSVAISGSTAIVGAFTEDENGPDSGSAYFFEIDPDLPPLSTSCSVYAPTATVPCGGTLIGVPDVALPTTAGTTTITWTYTDDQGNSVTQLQEVTVLEDTSAPIPDLSIGWEEAQKVLATDGNDNDQFGYSVAISGSLAIVGAYQDDDLGSNSGSVYVFERATGGSSNWVLVKKIKAFDGLFGDYFGYSVAIDGSTAIVGAYQDDDLGFNSGSAYVFEKDAGGLNNWGQVKKLKALAGATDDYFGYSVAISGTKALVGANQGDGNEIDSGSAYLFEKDAGGANNWGEVKKLRASDGAVGDYFGWSVAISGGTAIIGAIAEDFLSGSAYIYEKDAGGVDNWGELKKLSPLDGGGFLDYFGWSVAISGNSAIVGAYRADGMEINSGAAYVFEKSAATANNWAEVAKLRASDGTGGDNFGNSVAISGNKVVVGVRQDDDLGNASGSAYVFEKDAGATDSWVEVQKLLASDGAGMDDFGRSVAISGSTVIVGAIGDDDMGEVSGSTYLVEFDPNLPAYEGFCSANPITPTATNLCDGVQITGVPNVEFPITASGTTITWTYTDAAGNIMTQLQEVVLTDNEAPSFTCPEDLTLNTDPGESHATAALTAPVASDNCELLGNALSFDGQNDFVDLGNIAGTNFGVGDFTIEFWMNTTSIPEALTPIISKRAICNCANFWNVSLNIDGTLLFEAFENTGCGNPIGVLTSNSVNDGAWHHIAITRTFNSIGFPFFEDNAFVTIYVDGSLSTSAQYPYLTFLNNADPVQIGRSACSDVGTPLYYEGQLDEVRMWSYARPQGLIQGSMRSELDVQPGLLASYHFNEGLAGGDNAVETTAYDATVNGNDGALNNFALTGNTSNWINHGVSTTNNAPSTIPIGSTIVTWTATDAQGNPSTCDQTITVIDNEAPLINCETDQTLINDPGEIFATNSLPPFIAVDNSNILGNALNFDGVDDKVSISNPFDGSVFTIEAWIKTSAIGLTGTFAYQGDPLLWSDVFGGGNDFTLAILNNRLSFFDGSAEIETDGTTILNDDTWHHIAVVRNGIAGTTVLYVDGLADGSGACNNVQLNANPGIVIGGNLIDQNYFNGSIDEVRIWSVPRTEAQIQTGMDEGIDSETGLLASYRFNEGIAGGNNAGITTANDASGNANDGTLTGFGLTGLSSNWVDSGGMTLTNDAPATFPIGTTAVTWTATDASGNSSICQFDVTVLGQPVNDDCFSALPIGCYDAFTYYGVAYQPGFGGYGMVVEFAPDFSSASVDYVDLCPATWTLQSQDGMTYTYLESAAGACFDGCVITIEMLPNGTIDYFSDCGVGYFGTGIATLSNSILGNTTLATPETIGAFTGANEDARSLWYTFVGSNSADSGAASGTPGDQVLLSTCNDFGATLGNGAYDTKIDVYSGDCSSPLYIGGNDDGGSCTDVPLYTSVFSFPTTVGTVYYVRMYGYASNSYGDFELSMECSPSCLSVPSNDVCSSSETLALGFFGDAPATFGTTECATTEVLNNLCDPFGEVLGVWYDFVTDDTGETFLDLSYGTASSLSYAVYEVGPCDGTAVEVGCDYNNAPYSQVVYSLLPNTSYKLLVYSQFNTAGTFWVGVTSGTAAPVCQVPLDMDVVEIGFGTANARVNATWTNPEGTTSCEVRGGRISPSSYAAGEPEFANPAQTRTITQTNGSTVLFNIVLYNNPNVPFVIGQRYGYDVRCSCADGSGFSDWSNITPQATFVVPAPPPGAEPSGGDKLFTAGIDRMSVFPNPAEEMVNVELVLMEEGTVEIILLDALGQTVTQMRASGKTTMNRMDVSELSAGMYMLTVRTNSGVVAKRLIVN